MPPDPSRIAAFQVERRIRILVAQGTRPRLVVHNGREAAPPIERVPDAEEQYAVAREVANIALKLGPTDLYRLREVARAMAANLEPGPGSRRER
jgi:hypothetical protein